MYSTIFTFWGVEEQQHSTVSTAFIPYNSLHVMWNLDQRVIHFFNFAPSKADALKGLR